VASATPFLCAEVFSVNATATATATPTTGATATRTNTSTATSTATATATATDITNGWCGYCAPQQTRAPATTTSSAHPGRNTNYCGAGHPVLVLWSFPNAYSYLHASHKI
jgi:hypothetical protein